MDRQALQSWLEFPPIVSEDFAENRVARGVLLQVREGLAEELGQARSKTIVGQFVGEVCSGKDEKRRHNDIEQQVLTAGWTRRAAELALMRRPCVRKPPLWRCRHLGRKTGVWRCNKGK